MTASLLKNERLQPQKNDSSKARLLHEEEFKPLIDNDQALDVWIRYQQVLDAEEQGFTTTDKERLQSAGIRVPHPQLVSDTEIHGVLWDVLDGLARMHVYLLSTDHLSDRELYEILWRKYLSQLVPCLAPENTSISLIDMAWADGPEDETTFLVYYADSLIRRHWTQDHPGSVLPKRRKRIYDRDSQLPQPNPGQGYLHVMARFPEPSEAWN